MTAVRPAGLAVPIGVFRASLQPMPDRAPDPDEWRQDAMQRPSAIDTAESLRRQAIADAHNLRQGIADPDTLADQQLYVQGKMDIEEYQRYLLEKHARQTSQ